MPRLPLAPPPSILALEALQYVVADQEWLGRFLAESGADAAALRSGANDPAFLAAVLDFVASHEALAAAFCAACGLDGARLERARHLLAAELGQP